MDTTLNGAQRMALTALRDGILRAADGAWIASGAREDLVLPDGIVRWLIGERFVEKLPPGTGEPDAYRLSERGRQAAGQAFAMERTNALAAEVSESLERMPVLLVAPAAHSEELDWLMAIPVDQPDRERHRRRLGGLRGWLDEAPDRFEFVQYADDLFAVPLGPRLASAGLVPDEREGAILVAEGLPAPADLGAQRCSDRGVNYGPDWVQWFGGFDRELPLIVSARLSHDALVRHLRNAGRGGLAAQ